MRVALFLEGVPTLDGRVIEAATWPETVPAIIDDWPVGTVTGIRREEGRVTGLVTTDRDLTGLTAEAGFRSGGAPHLSDGTWRLREPLLIYVRFGHAPCWPGMVIE